MIPHRPARTHAQALEEKSRLRPRRRKQPSSRYTRKAQQEAAEEERQRLGTEQLRARCRVARCAADASKGDAPSEALISSELDVIKAKEAAHQAQIEALGRDAAAAATKAKAESEAVKAEAALAKEAARRELKLAKAEAAQEAAKNRRSWQRSKEKRRWPSPRRRPCANSS